MDSAKLFGLIIWGIILGILPALKLVLIYLKDDAWGDFIYLLRGREE